MAIATRLEAIAIWLERINLSKGNILDHPSQFLADWMPGHSSLHGTGSSSHHLLFHWPFGSIQMSFLAEA